MNTSFASLASRPHVFSTAPFRNRARRLGAVLCVALMTQFLWVPLEGNPGAARVQLQKQTSVRTQSQGQALSKAFSITGNNRDSLEFKVEAPGPLQAKVQWTGTANKLALILNGPGMTQAYARQDGPSPLSLSFTITPELFAKGTNWTISVANFQAGASVQGTIQVTPPRYQPPSGASGLKAAGASQTQTQVQTTGPTAKTQDKGKVTAAGAQEKPTLATGVKPKASTGLKTALGKQKRTGTETPGLALLRARTEEVITKATRSSPMAGILIPLFFHEMENIAGNPALLKQYYGLSRHKKRQTEREFASHFENAVRAYRDIPADFKTKYLHPSFASLAKGQHIDAQKLGDDIIRTIKPSFRADVKQAVKASFAPKRLTIQPSPRRGPPAAVRKASAQQAGTTAATAGSGAQIQASRINRLLRGGASGLSLAQKDDLKAAVASSGFPIPQQSTIHPAFYAMDTLGSLKGALPLLNDKQSVVDYYRYMITLDWFSCINKNEYSDDEPYFGLITVLPQFDPSDPAFFHYLKDGCLNNVAGFTTRTYGGVEGGSNHGLTGNDRVVFDYLTFNAPASFTVDLWEEDYSQGSVADGIQQAAMDIGAQVLQDVKAAVITQAISVLKEALLEQLASAGISFNTSAVMQFIDQLIGGDLSFADFEQLLYNLFSGKGINPAWYVVYFVFSGFDLAATLAAIGAGSTVVGLVILAIAIFGPAISDMFSNFADGNIGAAMVDLLKILTVIPLIFEFFARIFDGFKDFFNWLMSIIDPDDHIGTKTIVMEKTSSDWHNDAMDGEWTQAKLMGTVPVNYANQGFAQKGYGPTWDNSSFNLGSVFWVPGFTIKNEYTIYLPNGQPYTGVGTEYNIYYEVKREVAGGRSSFGYYLPEPGVQYREIMYTSKSSAAAWWKNVIRVSVMSINTTDFPWVCLINTKTGETASNLAPGQAVFEVDASPGTTYKLSIWKFTPGEMAGYVSVYEGPVVAVECQYNAPTGAGGGGGARAGQGLPPKKQR